MAISVETLAREEGRGRISLLDPTREYAAHRAEVLARAGASSVASWSSAEMAAYLGTRRACGVASETDALRLRVTEGSEAGVAI